MYNNKYIKTLGENIMKKFFNEFKKFISKGNVIDLAVGVIIGGAFTAIVTALTDGIFKPLINFIISLITGGDSASDIYTFLKVVKDSSGNVDMSASIYIDWGGLISAILNFFIIALILFFIIKAFNSAKDLASNPAVIEKSISYKNAHNIKLTRKEKAYLEIKEKEEIAKKEAEKKALEEANKLTKTEALLTEIKTLLENKK